MEIIVTKHAKERFQEHHPHSGHNGIKKAFSESIDISEDMGRILSARFWNHKHDEKTYFRLALDRKGEFVYVKKDDYIIITYLRFCIEQQIFVWNNWFPNSDSEKRELENFAYKNPHLVSQLNYVEQENNDIYVVAHA